VNKRLKCGYNKKGPSRAMSDGHQVCSWYRCFRRRSGGGAYWMFSSESSSSPVPWLEPEEVSLLDPIAPSPSASPASSPPNSPELVVPALEEPSWPAAADVPGRA
jgi:hypothetical protein